MAPKGSGEPTYPHEIEPPPGLPDNWTAMLHIYQSGAYEGKTYMRFKSNDGRHRHICSVLKAIEKDAVDRGLNAESVVAAYKKLQDDEKKAEKAERERSGKMLGEMRDKAIEAFRVKYGNLDGATVACLPGWRAESIFRETCQQTAVTYYTPDNKPYHTVKDVQAMLGMMVLDGKEVKIVEEARKRVEVDETGRAVNAARKEITFIKDVDGELMEGGGAPPGADPASKRRRVASSEDYAASDLRLLPARGDRGEKALAAAGVDGAQDVLKLAAEIHGLLVARGFSEGTELLCAHGVAPGHRLAGALERALFYELPERFSGRPCFQKVAKGGADALCCSGIYVSWSADSERWKLGSLSETKAGIAYVAHDQPTPTSVSLPWQLLRGAS